MGGATEDSALPFSDGAQKGHDTEKNSKNSTVPFYKLFSFADSWDLFFMTLGVIGAIGNGLSRPLMTILLGELIDMLAGSQTNHTHTHTHPHLFQVPLKVFYLAFGCGVGAFLQVYCWMITGERQAARVRSLYLKSILRQDIAYFDLKVSTGDVIERINSDSFLFQDAIGEKVGTFVQVLTTAIGGFLIAFVKGWLLAFVMLSSYPLIFLSRRTMNFLRQNKLLQSQTAYANVSNLVQQTLGSIRTVASFTGEKQVLTSYKKLLTDAYKCDTCIAFNTGLEAGVHHFLALTTIGLGVWFGARMVLHEDYTPGQFFTVFLAIILGTSYTTVRQAYPCMVAFAAGQVSAFKMFDVINRNPTIDAYDAKGKIFDDDIRGDIELKNVFFSYPSRPKEPTLDGFSLSIPSCTTTALIGQSGSGKSTVISLIERFYDPQLGQVLIDEMDIRDFQLKWIRSKISLVSQEPVLFTATIKDNIAYGKDGATLEEIKAATVLAKADDFINKLPQGLDTRVGEYGIQLSGGQKQRVAIARAIIKNPRILLLDEATSALDTNSERIVQEALEKIMADRTTVVVAHRLSTIRNANMIAVLRQGKIIEKGTHSELLKDLQGVYSTLISNQETPQLLERSNEYDSDIGIAGAKYGPSISSEHYSSLDSPDMESINFKSMSMITSEITYGDQDKCLESLPKDSQQVSIFWLAQLNKPEFPLLIVASIFAIMTGAMAPTYAFLISSVIRTFYELPHKLEKDSKFWALMMLILGVVSLISHPLKGYLFGIAGNKLIQRIRLKCFEKVINMEIGWFDDPENSSGVIGARLSNDAAKVRVLVGDALGDLVQIVSSMAIGLTISFAASWQLSLIILAMIPLIVFNIYVQMKSMKGFSNNAKVKYEEGSQVAKDAIENIRTVASFSAQEMILELYKKKHQVPMGSEAKQGLISGIGFGVSVCLLYLVYAIIFYTGARFVQHRKIAASDVFQVFYALNAMSFAIYSSTTIATDSNKAKTASASIFGLLRKESKINSGDESSGITLENINGIIELKHVNFSYPTRLDVLILRDLSLTIPSGKVVGLVGESGSGKSTVISLLQRFYDPNSGHITLDGIDIHKFQLKWLRQQIGLVSQEPTLFNDTIRANIAIGKGGSASEIEIIAAAKLANAHEFISSLQEGYDTIVGERGIQLSGGQKQRVAIARAIVKNPKILLLDEATSALDVDSEMIVQRALDTVMSNKTTIVVAHRLSTIKRADVIVVFKNGSIVEKGNHDSLIDMKEGLYSSLVNTSLQ